MKKFLLIASFFAAMSSVTFASDDIWGNENDGSASVGESEVFGGNTWLKARPTEGGWAGGDEIGSETNEKPGIPVGEGLLIMLVGGGLYAASKLRRK